MEKGLINQVRMINCSLIAKNLDLLQNSFSSKRAWEKANTSTNDGFKSDRNVQLKEC